jgi:diguanylate cyclase (GGDEF)-like protein
MSDVTPQLYTRYDSEPERCHEGRDLLALCRHLKDVLNSGDCGTVTFDKDLNLLFVSDRAGAILGVTEERRAGCTTLGDLLKSSQSLGGAMADLVQDKAAAVVAGREVEAALESEPVEGGLIHVVTMARVSPEAWAFRCEDVTTRRAAESEAAEIAMLDPLTALANRQLFGVRATSSLASLDADCVWMLLIDLDRFKAVNDTLGHPIGDTLLKLVAKRLRSVIGTHDVAARLGGDEFAMLLTGDRPRTAVADLAKRLIDVVGRPYLIDGHVVHVGASVGIASAPHDATDYDQLSRNADLAMYASKKAGRNTFSFFEPSMDERALARRSLEIDLRKAIALRQFEVHYQPQIDLEKDAIVGFEALVRWRHPERGLVLPGAFVPLAEEIGLITSIGEWVLREACMEAVKWPTTMTVSVNVSPCQFEHTQALVAAVGKALKTSGLPGNRLEIEITEGVLLRNEKAVLSALHQFRDLGVLIAMDDFGTGYSSLSQLNSFPFNKIKIDQSFVNGDSANNNAIIRAISALGLSLGMSTIAEGVETPEELARIRSNGCTSVQGYLYSKPISPAGISALIDGFVTRQSNDQPKAA